MTATTSRELAQATRNVEAMNRAIATQRNEIAALAVKPNSTPHDLARAVNELARLEGRLRANTVAQEIYQQDVANPDRVVERALLMEIGRGADDEWSGRVNDTRRSYFDGLRDEVNDIVRSFGMI